MSLPTPGFDESKIRRSGDGKFTTKGFAESADGTEADLGAFGQHATHDHVVSSFDPGYVVDHGGLPVDVDQITHASSEELWEVVEHPDWRVRMYAASAINLTTDQMKVLSDPETQPVAVRLSVAALSNPGVAARAATDPDPLVRQHALHFGWDLPENTRRDLASDRAVAAVDKVIPAGVI